VRSLSPWSQLRHSREGSSYSQTWSSRISWSRSHLMCPKWCFSALNLCGAPPSDAHASPDHHSPKLIPWFVSDVTTVDFSSTVHSLLDPSFFHCPSPDPSAKAHLSALVSRLQTHIAQGRFALSVNPRTPLGARDERADFWTEPWPYWDMKVRARSLWECLRESGLVVFKVRASPSHRADFGS